MDFSYLDDWTEEEEIVEEAGEGYRNVWVFAEAPEGEKTRLFESLGLRPGELEGGVRRWDVDPGAWAQARLSNRTSPWFDWQ